MALMKTLRTGCQQILNTLSAEEERANLLIGLREQYCTEARKVARA